MPWPSVDEEVWRYSPVGETSLDAWTLAAEPGQTSPSALAATLAPAAIVQLSNGHVRSVEVRAGADSPKVRIGPASDVDTASSLLGSVSGEDTDLVVALNDAFAPTPLVIDIAAGGVVDGPILLLDHTDVADGVVVPSRVVLRAGADAEVSVVSHRTSADTQFLAVPVVELDVAQAARVRYCDVQELGPRAWQFAHQLATVAASATATIVQAAFGGSYARSRTDCSLAGRGASGALSALYFGTDDQTHDFRTFQDHIGADTTSDLLFKGAVDNAARSIYTGLIKVGPDARGTNAHQTNRNVKLSPDAWAESVPNLEIENNDVKCSHASTVGPIDEDQRFYLESRGVEPDAAERLVVAGFFEDVIAKTAREGVDAHLRHAVGEKLAGGQR